MFNFLSCFLGRGDLMTTRTARNHNNRWMVRRGQKAATWTGKKKVNIFFYSFSNIITL